MDWIERNIQSAIQQGPDVYWTIAEPVTFLTLADANRHVFHNCPGREGYDRFVYWPKYRVAGTVDEIAQVFREEGVYVRPDLVYQDSIDPLNPHHQQELQRLSQIQGSSDLYGGYTGRFF